MYAAAEIGGAIGIRARPAVLVVDFSCGFTDPSCALGSEMTPRSRRPPRLLDVARGHDLPVVFTTIGFDARMSDAGIWPAKMPAPRPT